MLAFTTQQTILRIGGGQGDRASCMQMAALMVMTYVSLNLASATDFQDAGAFSNLQSDSPSSLIVRDTRPKNLGGFSTNNAAIGIKAATVADESDSSICNEKRQPLCRDLAASEFQLTSLRFMLPEVRGLTAKSLNIRRNSVSATYTFR